MTHFHPLLIVHRPLLSEVLLGSFSAIKFSVVSKLVIKCGEKPQCLRNPDFVRFSQKYPETQTTLKNPDLVENPKKHFWGPAVLNQWQIKDSCPYLRK